MYGIGQNRIFFQSNFLEGQTVEIEIVNPRLEKSQRLKMTYLDEVLYYVDLEFKYRGSYTMRVFQDGKRVGHSILPVGNIGGIITKK